METSPANDDLVYILVVDDRPANLIVVQAILDDKDYVVVTADSGPAALSLLESQEFAVILTDVMMPDMDGLEFVSEIKKKDFLKDLPIIFMTAMAADMSDIFRGYAVGAVDYLQKPFEPEVLKAKVAVFAQIFRQKQLIKRQAAEILRKEREESILIKNSLEQRIAQQLSLAEFGRLALVQNSGLLLKQEATVVLQRILQIEESCILMFKEDRRELILRASHGADESLFNEFSRQNQSRLREIFGQEFHTVFADADFEGLSDFGITGGAAVAIQGIARPLGVLCVFDRSNRVYSSAELSYLRALASILGIACERYRSELAIRELARSNEDLEQFSFAASHDLQEPLRKMLGFSTILQNEYSDKLDENGRTYVGFILDGAERMKTLISEFLELSRIGYENIEAEPIPLSAPLREALKSLDSQIRESGARFEIADLPSIPMNPAAMLRLFQNLISNSIKFRSSDPPLIRISCEKQELSWKIGIHDNGIGIEGNYLEKIFHMLFRVHGRNKYQGTGIGLAICRKIVEYHGGRIWAESGSGKGSTIYVSFPLTPRL